MFYLQSAIHSRLGWPENVHFLEQFRYLIVASQLLNEHTNPKTYQRQNLPPPGGDGLSPWGTEQGFVPNPRGLVLTATIAFALAWSISWFRSQVIADYSISTVLLSMSIIIITFIVLYYYSRRKWLQYLRVQAVESASSLISTAQDFDAAVIAGITLVQEVELISRGYNMCVQENAEEHSLLMACVEVARYPLSLALRIQVRLGSVRGYAARFTDH